MVRFTGKRDKQKFPVRKRAFKKDKKLDSTLSPTLSATNYSDEYRRILQEKDRFTRRLNFAAFLADRLRKIGVSSVLVGGAAVELYTNGDFATMDMDFNVSDLEKTVKVLKGLGFREEDSLWYNPELDILLDLSSYGYSGDTEKIRIFELKNYTLRVAAPEDLIVNRLYSAKFWKSNPQRDMEEATALLSIFKDKLAEEYLAKIAKENDVEDFLVNAKQNT